MLVISVAKLQALVSGKPFAGLIMFSIIFNGVMVGLQTYPSLYEPYHAAFHVLDLVLLSIFALEAVLKIAAYRGAYFRDGWNVMDFAIVAASLLLMGSNYIAVLRILRVLRTLRAISAVRSMRRLVTSLFMAVPTIGSISLLIFIIFYIYAVIGTMFFGKVMPDYFGSLQLSMITLFQVFTLESWASGVFRPIFAEVGWSWFYFVSFILLSTFVMLNLIVGEIVNNAQKLNSIEEAEAGTAPAHASAAEVEELRRELRELKYILLEERREREKHIS